MKARTLSYAVLGAILAVGFQVAPVHGAQPQNAATVQSVKSDANQDTFIAGPGIAVANTESGKIQGYVDNGIYNYRGVPYAEATERFKPAHKVTPWEGTKMMVQNGPISPQAHWDFVS